MMMAIKDHACGVLTVHGQKVVVVAGGTTDPDTIVDKVALYFATDKEWHWGSELPSPATRGHFIRANGESHRSYTAQCATDNAVSRTMAGLRFVGGHSSFGQVDGKMLLFSHKRDTDTDTDTWHWTSTRDSFSVGTFSGSGHKLMTFKYPVSTTYNNSKQIRACDEMSMLRHFFLQLVLAESFFMVSSKTSTDASALSLQPIQGQWGNDDVWKASASSKDDSLNDVSSTIDGRLFERPDGANCFATLEESEPWWRLDLANVWTVDQVQIHLRNHKVGRVSL